MVVGLGLVGKKRVEVVEWKSGCWKEWSWLLCFVELCCDDLSLRSAVWYMYSSSRRRHRHRVANPEAVDRRVWESLFSGTHSSAQTRTMLTPPTTKTTRFHSAGLINFPKPFKAAFQGVMLGMVAASGKRSGCCGIAEVMTRWPRLAQA